jgi:UDPglucose 6-dehydrogenase
MKISIVGTGYVGLVSGTCFANLGNDVICLDIDEKKVKDLKSGKIPIYEPGLSELFERNIKEKRLLFTTNTKDAIEKSDVIFLCVGTPPNEFHEADLTAVKAVAKDIGKYINDYKVIVNKSTVPVGTADMVKKIINENLNKKDIKFDVVSNPEFLREGAAVKDFQNPDRVVIGTESKKAKEIMTKIYSGVARIENPIMVTDIKSSELIKYASNSMLATRISFMNQLSHLCEKTGADIKEVAKGMGLDNRIGSRFLQAGVGYGGSCFPKDVLALISTMKEHKLKSNLFDSVHSVNENQKLVVVDKLTSILDVKDKTIAVWGIAFKPKTDDIREAPAIKIIHKLQEMGAKIHAFDPVAMDNAKKELKDVKYFNTAYDTIKNTDALIIVTEWDEFRNLDKEAIKVLMKQPIIIDGRNVYNPKDMKKLGFTYMGIGR